VALAAHLTRSAPKPVCAPFLSNPLAARGRSTRREPFITRQGRRLTRGCATLRLAC
jgi:hypothetical protein